MGLDKFEPEGLQSICAVRYSFPSGEWELLLEEDGTLCLVCVVQPLKEDDEVSRYILPIGSCFFDNPVDLIEGLNMIQSQGLSVADPN